MKIIIYTLVFLLLLSVAGHATTSEWAKNITLGQVGGQQYGIQIFGMKSGATDGWDGPAIDALKYPDAAIGKAWFSIPAASPTDKVSRDMRSTGNSAVWQLTVEPSSDDDWYAQWNTNGFPSHTLCMLYETDDTFTNITGMSLNMMTSNTYLIPRDTKKYYAIHYYDLSANGDFITSISLRQQSGQMYGIQILGMTDGASDNWDGNTIDSFKYPDSMLGRAWFVINESPPVNTLSRDMREYNHTKVWHLYVEPSDIEDWTAHLTIENMLPERQLYWQEVHSNYVTVIGPSLNMALTNNIAIPKAQSHYYKISLVPEPIYLCIISLCCTAILFRKGD